MNEAVQWCIECGEEGIVIVEACDKCGGGVCRACVETHRKTC